MTYTRHRSASLAIMQDRARALVTLCEGVFGRKIDMIDGCSLDAELIKAILKAVIAHDATLLRLFRAEIAKDVLELPYVMIHFREDRWDEGGWHRDDDDNARRMHWVPLRVSGTAISFLPDVPLDLTRVVARAARAAGIKKVTTPRLNADEYLTWPATTYHRGILNDGEATRINYIVTVRPGADGEQIAAQTVALDDDMVVAYCRAAHAALADIAAGRAHDPSSIDSLCRQLFATSLHALSLKEPHLGTQAFSAAAADARRAA